MQAGSRYYVFSENLSFKSGQLKAFKIFVEDSEYCTLYHFPHLVLLK